MDCIFCKIAKKEIASNILYEDNDLMVIMDLHPVNDGHVLVIPKKHYTDYMELDKEMAFNMLKVAQEIGPKIMNKLDKRALTLLVNYGTDQEVKHLHLHLIPNFSKRNNTKVKNVKETFEILKNE